MNQLYRGKPTPQSYSDWEEIDWEEIDGYIHQWEKEYRGRWLEKLFQKIPTPDLIKSWRAQIKRYAIKHQINQKNELSRISHTGTR